MEQVLEALQPAFLMVIEGVATAVVPVLLWHLNAWMKAKSHDARFHCAMDRVTTIAESSVLDVMQTYVDRVRRSGTWDGDAAIEAKKKAMALAKERLGPAGLKELRGCLGHDDAGIESVIAGELERAVVLAKSKTA